MSYFNNRFPSWGEAGESPPDGFSYSGGDLVNEKHLDYLWDALRKQTNDIQTAIDDIDADSDGTVDAADTARLLKGNDIDSNADGTVDAADTAALFKGNDIDSDGDGTVNSADTAALFKGNDIDTDGDGVVNEADDTTTVKGNDIDSDGDGTVDKADDVVRRYRETNIPNTDMADGDDAVGLRRHLASGDTMNIWEIGVLNDAGNVPNGLNITVQDGGTDVISQNTRLSEGSPIASVSGATTITIKVENDTGSPQNASGFVLYSID